MAHATAQSIARGSLVANGVSRVLAIDRYTDGRGRERDAGRPAAAASLRTSAWLRSASSVRARRVPTRSPMRCRPRALAGRGR